MAFNFSIGGQIIGDLSGSDDSDRNTVIDFEEDYIGFVTSGSTILSISGSDVYLANGSNLYLDGGSNLYFDSSPTPASVFISEVGDGSNSLNIDANNVLYLTADESVRVMNNSSTKVIFDFNNDVAEVEMPISSSTTIEGGTLVNNGGRKANVASVTSTPFSVSTSHHMLAVNTDSAKTLNLPQVSNSDAGVVLIIMDAFGSSETAGANNNNITINAHSGQYVGANSSYTINTMGGVVSLVALDSNGWGIFNKITS
tara:strand:+ start:1069 stop:1836 length:768 start_codon:yes stop_codon:yes gene_type:complete